MRLLLLPAIFISLSFFSCVKEINTPSETLRTTNSTEKKNWVINLDSSILTVTINPVLSCYSYANNEAPRPCDVDMELSCSLTRPIAAAIRVEVEKKSIMEITQSTSNSANAIAESAVVINLGPNQRSMSVKLYRITDASPQTTRTKYNLKSVAVYNMIN